MNSNRQVSLNAIDFYFGDNKVLDAVTLNAERRDRIALVGENGSGKSTLLKVIAGELEPEAGTAEIVENLALLAQENTAPGSTTKAELIAQALAPVKALEAALKSAADALALQEPDDSAQRAQLEQAYAEALTEAEIADIWNADVRVTQTLAGLDLTDIEDSRQISQMSGGQERRLALACLLIRRPSLMLLDEPTNHVDDAGLEYLQNTLKDFPGTVVMSSHDRQFLDATATAIFDLDPFEAAVRDKARGKRGGESGFLQNDATEEYKDERLYNGNYSNYLREKRQERATWEAQYEREQEELRYLANEGEQKARDIKHRDRKDNNKMGYGMRGQRVEKQVSRRIRAAESKLEQLRAHQLERPPLALTLNAESIDGAPSQKGAPIIKLESAGIAGRLAPVSHVLKRGEKVLLTGPNGSGKSTLLSMLAGDLLATEGRVLRVKGLNVALLEQEVGLQNDDRTPQEIYDLVTGNLIDAPGILEYGLLRPQDIEKPLRALSAGVRRRLILQLQLVQAPDVLILDEPTNHLSLTLIEELSAAIAKTDIAVVVATHDRWMRSTWPKGGTKIQLAAN